MKIPNLTTPRRHGPGALPGEQICGKIQAPISPYNLLSPPCFSPKASPFTACLMHRVPGQVVGDGPTSGRGIVQKCKTGTSLSTDSRFLRPKGRPKCRSSRFTCGSRLNSQAPPVGLMSRITCEPACLMSQVDPLIRLHLHTKNIILLQWLLSSNHFIEMFTREYVALLKN